MANDLFDKPMEAGGEEHHLTPETLGAYLDDELSAGAQRVASAHLETCQHCQDELQSLRATTMLVRRLPEPRPARSFQLSPEHATAERGMVASGWLTRMLGWMPALRAATAGVALLLVVVIAGDVLTNRDNGGPEQQPVYAPSTSSAQISFPSSTAAAEKAAPTNTVENMTMAQAAEPSETENELANSGAAGEAAPEETAGAESATQEEVSALAAQDSAAADQSRAAEPQATSAGAEQPEAPAAAAAAESSPTPEPTASPKPTATPQPTATAQPTATPTPSELSGTSESRVSNWRIAEIALGLLLAWLLVTLVGLRRLTRG